MARKMARKGVSLGEVFDARALRVVVDDSRGSQAAGAVTSCLVSERYVYACAKMMHAWNCCGQSIGEQS